MTCPAVHPFQALSEDRPLAMLPVARARGLDWPGDGPVAFVPAVLLLAMTGRCCCDSCVDEHVRATRPTRLQSV